MQQPGERELRCCVHVFDSGTMAKGLSGIDPAVPLDRVDGIEVAELNPKIAIVRPSIRRSKVGAADVEVLAEYSRRMPFIPYLEVMRRAIPASCNRRSCTPCLLSRQARNR
jgi:hypothetical protein